MKIIAVEVTTYAVAKRKPQLHKLRFQLRRSSIHLFLHPAVQIYEIQEISYFSAKMVYIKCLIFLFVKHFLFFLFLFFFYSLQTQDRPDFCSGCLQRKRAFHKSELPSS